MVKELVVSPKMLEESMEQFRLMFSQDTDLVADSAREHGVAVTQGSILEPPTDGAYSARIPQGSPEEVQALESARRIVLACMDYRQAYQVAGVTKADLVIATAGGAAQPEENRRKATVQLLKNIRQVNPNAVLVLTGHDHICGGVNHFTNGEMKKTYETSGPVAEKLAMKEHLRTLARNLRGEGVRLTSVTVALAHVDENNHFAGLEILPISGSLRQIT